MRTLKKTLALVLVVALVLSISVIGANAFTDSSKINANYADAVQLLSDTGVIDGFADGTFQPAGILTREQAAKVICYLLLGATNADKICVASSQIFDDVKADRWSAGYIEYLYNLKYVDGVDAKNFDPTGKLSTAAFEKLILCALGYDATTEGLNGTSWAISVAALAVKLGINDSSITISATTECTREMACQLVYCAIGANTVQYTGGSTTTINGVTIITGATLSNVTKTVSGVAHDVLAAEKWFGAVAATSSDDFGRTTTDYTLSNGKIISSISATPTLKYTAPVTSAKLFADLGLSANVAADKVAFIVDGVADETTTGTAAVGIDYAATTTVIGGNGTLTEVYYNSTAKTAKIVEVNTYFGTISAVTAATSVAKRSVTVADAAGTNVGKFATTSFAVDDTVLYTKATVSGAVVVESVDAVSATSLTATSIVANTSFVAGTTTYKYSANATSTKLTGAAGDFAAKNVYLDKYGYVIDIEGVTVTTNYAVVLNAADGTTGTWPNVATVHQAQLLKTDGSVAVVVGAAAYTTLIGKLVTYTVSSDVYTLTDAGATAETNANLAITKGASAFTFGSTFNGNAKTIYLVRSGAGSTASPYTYASYTGIASVPSMSATATANGLVLTSGTPAIAKVVYITGASTTAATTSDLIFVSGVYSTSTVLVSGTPVSYYTGYAQVNGTVETLNFASNYAMGLYTVKSANSYGYVTLATTTGTAITSIAKYTKDSGVISINGTVFSTSSSIAVYTYSLSTGAISTASLSSILGTETAGLYTVDKTVTNMVTAIYIPVA